MFQNIRYWRNGGAKPLWPMSSGQPSKADIPKCNYCGGPLCFEFQVCTLCLYKISVKCFFYILLSYLFTRSISPIKLDETFGWCLFCWWFQILPQLFYYFSVNNEVDSLDWATIVAYTWVSLTNRNMLGFNSLRHLLLYLDSYLSFDFFFWLFIFLQFTYSVLFSWYELWEGEKSTYLLINTHRWIVG